MYLAQPPRTRPLHPALSRIGRDGPLTAFVVVTGLFSMVWQVLAAPDWIHGRSALLLPSRTQRDPPEPAG
jgi:hypothetical protein